MILDTTTDVLIASVLGTLIVVALVIVSSNRQARRKREALERLARGLGRLEPNVPMLGTHQGVAFQLFYKPEAPREPASLTLTLPSKSPEYFVLAKEGASDRFFKGAGISVEIQTGDPAFDQQVYIESESPAFMRALLGTAERRAAAREILRAGFTEITQDHGELTATWEPFSIEAGVEPATIQAAALHLATLRAGAAEAPTPAPATPVSPASKGRLAIVMVLSFAPWVLAVAAYLLDRWMHDDFYPLDYWAVWLDSLKLAAVGFVVVLVVGIVRLRGTSRAHRSLLFRLAPFLFLLTFGCHTLTTLLNAKLDRSAPLTRTARVMDKREVKGQYGTYSYYVTVASWRVPGQLEELPVAAGAFGRISPGASSLVVRTGAGRFGHEWVVEARPATVAEVIAIHDAAVDAQPSNDRVFYERGLAYLHAGNQLRAIEDFKKAIELNPQHGEAYRYTAWAHGQQGDHLEAIILLTALLQLDPRDSEAYYGRSWNRNKRNDRAGALSDLTRACELGHVKACEVVRRAPGGR